MSSLTQRLATTLPGITCFLLVLLLAATAFRGNASDTTLLLMAVSILMFGLCWGSAIRVIGARAALHFVAIAASLGWFAEEMGASHGWFFGDYDYTDVLGPTLGQVPIVIPLMWFVLCYVGYVLANLIVWHKPSDGLAPFKQTLVMSLLAAMIVTAYDLGADPYMVYVLKAWIMAKTDGWWFGETVQGFVGWMLVSFTIICTFRLSLGKVAPEPAPARPLTRGPVLLVLAIYGGNMLFQVALGYPVEIRSIAVFAMGIPLLCSICGMVRWQQALQAAAADPAASLANDLAADLAQPAGALPRVVRNTEPAQPAASPASAVETA